jgi:two-component system LytT family response regulator
MMSSENQLTKLTAIIVDDELFGRENLKKIIETYCHEIDLLGCADSATSAKDLVNEHNPDVVFLDINMPVLDGFDFLNEYSDRNFMVVFVSAHDEFGINAVKAGAVEYLLKPINIKELKQTVKNLICIKNKKTKVEPLNETDKLVLPASHGFDLLAFEDLIRLEADGCYTKIFIKGEKTKIVCRTLKEFELALPKEIFLRIHKSHLINIKFIKEYSNLSGNYITMTDGSRVELSRRKTPEFIQKIKAALNVV